VETSVCKHFVEALTAWVWARKTRPEQRGCSGFYFPGGGITADFTTKRKRIIYDPRCDFGQHPPIFAELIPGAW
jgi:hypothetical protein